MITCITEGAIAVNPSTLFDAAVTDQQRYIIGYAVVRKTRCEIYNFVSPTLRILRFTEGNAEWRVGGVIQDYAAGDVVIFNNLDKRNIHAIKTDFISYELFDFYPAGFFSEQLWNVFYREEHRIVSAGDGAAPHIYALLDMLRDEILRPEDAYRIQGVQMYLNILTIEFQRQLQSRPDSSGMGFNATLFGVARSVRYISEHLSEDIRLGDLAEMCGYSPAHYSRVFKKYIGVSPVQYVVRSRLEKALQLMNNERMTILSAAYQSGFQSSSAFYKAFQAQYATSPTRYLKRIRTQSE